MSYAKDYSPDGVAEPVRAPAIAGQDDVEKIPDHRDSYQQDSRSDRPRSHRSHHSSRSPYIASHPRTGQVDDEYNAAGSIKRHESLRSRDGWAPDTEGAIRGESYAAEYTPYPREDERLRARPDSRRGPRSHPPQTMNNPALAGHYHGLGWAEYAPENQARSPRYPNRLGRGSFDTPPIRHRQADEEMGYMRSNSTPLRKRASSQTYNDSSRPNPMDWQNLSTKEKAEVLRLPLTAWMRSNVKNHFVAWLGELVGTTLFLFFAFAGTEVANIQSRAGGSQSQTTTGGATGFNLMVLLYVSLSFGFSLMVNVWVFFRISGGLFNPAVTFAMVLVRAISVTRALFLFVAQMGGALIASVVVRYLFPESFNVRTTLGGGTSLAQGVLIEAVLTAELVFTIIMLAKEKHRATFIAPVGIGLALFIAELVGVQFTGGSLNPARSFGPCVITLTFDSEHWIYWVGPIAGSLIAVVFYHFIKILEYEMANPGADGDPENDPTQNPAKRAEVCGSRSPSVHN